VPELAPTFLHGEPSAQPHGGQQGRPLPQQEALGGAEREAGTGLVLVLVLVFRGSSRAQAQLPAERQKKKKDIYISIFKSKYLYK